MISDIFLPASAVVTLLFAVWLLAIGCQPEAKLTDDSVDAPRESEINAITPEPLEEEWAIDWWMDRHRDKRDAPERTSARLLFLGNSITQGWETDGRAVWEEHYGDRDAFNLGFSGDRTENVLWRLEHGQVDGMDPELVVLMIGTNNTGHRQDPADETALGIATILDELEDRLPNSRILLSAIFPRGEQPDDPLRRLNDEINEQIAGLAEREQVYFMDINNRFLDEDGRLPEEIMPDFLHPNEDGYLIWAEAMEPILTELLDKR